MTRLFLLMVGLAFAGSLLLVSCEPPADTTKPGGKVETPKPPEKPATPTPPAVPDAPKPKTGALNIPGAADGVATINAASTKVASATTCALAGCTQPGNPTIALVKDGKPLMF